MTAVIGPVCIQHTDLGHGRISLLFILKIILDMQEILEGHRKIQGIVELLSTLPRPYPQKPSKIFTSSGSSNTVTSVSGFAVVCFTGIHRVNAEGLDRPRSAPRSVFRKSHRWSRNGSPAPPLHSEVSHTVLRNRLSGRTVPAETQRKRPYRLPL